MTFRIPRSFPAAAAIVAAVALVAVPGAALGAFGDAPPVVSKVKVSPSKFRALKSGSEIAPKGGAVVTFNLSDGGLMTVSFRHATAKGYKPVPGSFTYIGAYGENEMRIAGRVKSKAGKPPIALKPGRYRVVIKPEASGSRSAFGSFTILK